MLLHLISTTMKTYVVVILVIMECSYTAGEIDGEFV